MRLHLHFRPMFRSYKPVTDTLQQSVLPEAAPGEVADHVREELDNEHRGVEIDQLDFTNLVRELLIFDAVLSCQTFLELVSLRHFDAWVAITRS